MKSVWQSVFSLVLGFVGGVLAMNTGIRLNHHESDLRVGTVRAARFELVDGLGNSIAYWGKGNQGLSTEIAFSDQKGGIRARFGVEASQLVAKHPIAYSPFTALVGSDGKVRLQQRLDTSEYPVLAMGDASSENRILFGHLKTGDTTGSDEPQPWDKWGLVLGDASHGWRDYFDIGVTTPLGTGRRTGYAVLRDSMDRELTLLPKQ